MFGNKPLFNVGYIEGCKDGGSRVFFALHHLLVDAVSWRIIAHDLKELYTKLSVAKSENTLESNLNKSAEELLGAKGTSYRQWVQLCAKYDNLQEKEYWTKQRSALQENKQHLLALESKGSNYSSFSLNKEITSLLLRQSNTAYHTEINDILLSAFGLALAKLSKNNINYITLEGHGREEIFANVDISRTVGWFTSMYPVCLNVDTGNLSKTIINIKEQLRSIPNKGIGYGALFGYSDYNLPRTSFNYLGQFDSAVHGDQENKTRTVNNLWNIASESSGISVDADNTDNNLINANGLITNGELHFGIAAKLTKNNLNILVNEFKQQLTDIINYTSALNRSYLTVSDAANIILKNAVEI